MKVDLKLVVSVGFAGTASIIEISPGNSREEDEAIKELENSHVDDLYEHIAYDEFQRPGVYYVRCIANLPGDHSDLELSDLMWTRAVVS